MTRGRMIRKKISLLNIDAISRQNATENIIFPQKTDILHNTAPPYIFFAGLPEQRRLSVSKQRAVRGQPGNQRIVRANSCNFSIRASVAG